MSDDDQDNECPLCMEEIDVIFSNRFMTNIFVLALVDTNFAAFVGIISRKT